MQTRDQEVRIISCADATELGQPRNSFQKKKCLESWEPGAEHLSLADSQRPAQARDGSGMRVRCSSTPKSLWPPRRAPAHQKRFENRAEGFICKVSPASKVLCHRTRETEEKDHY